MEIPFARSRWFNHADTAWKFGGGPFPQQHLAGIRDLNSHIQQAPRHRFQCLPFEVFNKASYVADTRFFSSNGSSKFSTYFLQVRGFLLHPCEIAKMQNVENEFPELFYNHSRTKRQPVFENCFNTSCPSCFAQQNKFENSIKQSHFSMTSRNKNFFPERKVRWHQCVYGFSSKKRKNNKLRNNLLVRNKSL